METKEYTNIDRAGWPSGEWDNEPDKAQWPDPATGLPCLAKRHPWTGHWCGYVGVSSSHPHYGKSYNDIDASVHGGLTYADSCQVDTDESTGICHVPGPGEPDHVWWFGFDCEHYLDYSPREAKRAEEGGIWALDPSAQYRKLNYVKRECARLAAQLQEAT